MHLKDNGGPRGKYLICDKGKRGMGCTTVGYPYHGIESTFLRLIADVNLSELFDKQKQTSLLTQLNNKLDSLRGEHAELTNKINKLFELVEGGNIGNMTAKRIADHERTIGEIEKEIAGQEKLRDLEASRIAQTETHQEEVITAISEMDSLRGEERMMLRARVQQRIRMLVESIEIYSIGAKRTRAELKYLRSRVDELNRAGYHLTSGEEWVFGEVTRRYVIGFQSGRTFEVLPTKQDPCEVEMWIDTDNL
jgi:hypothetical protein